MLPLVESHILDKIHLQFPTVTVQLKCDASVPKIVLQFQGSEHDVELAGDWTEKQRGLFSWTTHTFDSNEAECLQTGIASNALDLQGMGKEFNATCDVSRLSEGILSVAAISPGDPRAFRQSIDAYLKCHLLVTSTYSLTDSQIEFLKRFRLQKPWLGFGDVIDQTSIEQLSPSFLGNCLFLKGLKQNVKFALKELENRFRRFREISFHLSYPEGSRRAFESELSTIETKLMEEEVFVAFSISKINKTVNVSLTGFCDLSSAKEAFVSLSKSLHRYRKPVRVSSDTRSIIYREALKINLPVGMDDDTIVIFSTSSEKSAEAAAALEELIEEVRTERMRSASADEYRDDYNLFSNSVKPSPSKPNFGAKILNVETDETPCHSLAFTSSASASASGVGAESAKSTSASEDNGIELESACASYVSSSRPKQESSLPESTDMNCFDRSLKTVLKEERTEFQLPNFPSTRSCSESTNPAASEFCPSEVPAASRCQETQIGRKKSKEIFRLQREHASNSLSESPRLLNEIPFLSLGKVIEIYSGSIAHECVDVIITATNEDLILQPDVAAIGGNSLEQECRQYVKDNGYVSSGHTVVTGGGNLRCKRLLHAVIALIDTEADLRARLRQCFDDVEAMCARSVALPLLFSDTYLSVETGFAITMEEIQRRFEEKCFVKVVRLVDSNPMLMNVAGAEALSLKSAAPPMRIFEWRYLNDDDRFQPFPFVINAQLEKFFAQAKGDMQLQVSDDVYDIFYETHTNLASGLVRPIRRCLKGSPCPNPDAKWYFIDEMKAQQRYDVASSFRLDSAFRRNARLVCIDVGAFSYEIDFVSMTEKDVKTGRKKRIVRVDVVDSLSPPRGPTIKEATGTGISSFFKKMFSKSETKRFRISSDTGVALSSDFRRIAETFGVEMNFVTDAGCESAEVQLKGVKSGVQKAYEAIQVDSSLISLYVKIFASKIYRR